MGAQEGKEERREERKEGERRRRSCLAATPHKSFYGIGTRKSWSEMRERRENKAIKSTRTFLVRGTEFKSRYTGVKNINSR